MTKIQFSILCEGFESDANTKFYSIKNAFEKISQPNFPAKVSFALVIYWIDEIEEIRKPSITATILDENSKKISGTSFFQINIPYKSYNISFCVFQDLIFPNSGTYFADIKIGDISTNTIPIPVDKF
jgi:hypothetical protein